MEENSLSIVGLIFNAGLVVQTGYSTFSEIGYTFSHFSGLKEKGTSEWTITKPEGALELLSAHFGTITRDQTRTVARVHSWLLGANAKLYFSVVSDYGLTQGWTDRHSGAQKQLRGSLFYDFSGLFSNTNGTKPKGIILFWLNIYKNTF